MVDERIVTLQRDWDPIVFTVSDLFFVQRNRKWNEEESPSLFQMKAIPLGSERIRFTRLSPLANM